MNKFQDYVTSAAFRLDLSRPMCIELAMCYVSHDQYHRQWDEERGFYREVGERPEAQLWPCTIVERHYGVTTLHALERRGLVAWSKDKEREDSPSYELHCTEEGRMVLELVIRAGLLPERVLEAIQKKREWLMEQAA